MQNAPKSSGSVEMSGDGGTSVSFMAHSPVQEPLDPALSGIAI